MINSQTILAPLTLTRSKGIIIEWGIIKIYRKKHALPVGGHFPGGKNGRKIGQQ